LGRCIAFVWQGQQRGTGVRASDEDSFGEFVETRWAGLRRTTFLLVGDSDHAEDLAAEVFTRLWFVWPRDALQRALRSLPARQRAVATVKSLTSRGMASLRATAANDPELADIVVRTAPEVKR
jgi:hypothetical protein